MIVETNNVTPNKHILCGVTHELLGRVQNGQPAGADVSRWAAFIPYGIAATSSCA